MHILMVFNFYKQENGHLENVPKKEKDIFFLTHARIKHLNLATRSLQWNSGSLKSRSLLLTRVVNPQ